MDPIKNRIIYIYSKKLSTIDVTNTTNEERAFKLDATKIIKICFMSENLKQKDYKKSR